jgi:hypothetical protein
MSIGWAGVLALLLNVNDAVEELPHAGVVYKAGSATAADQLRPSTVDVSKAQHLQLRKTLIVTLPAHMSYY